jgi:hypothetical protein
MHKVHTKLLAIVFVIICLIPILYIYTTATAYPGKITTSNVDKWEWQTSEAWTNGRNTVLKINDTNIFVTCAWGSTGIDKKGWLRTFSIYSNNGTIRRQLLSTWNFAATATGDGEYTQIKHIAGTDKYLVWWRGASAYNQLGTARIYENGTIQKSFISKKTMAYKGFARHMDNLTNNLWAFAYSDDASEDGMLETWYVYANNGTIVSVANDTVEFDPVFAGSPSFVKVDSDTIAIAYSNISSTGDWTIATYNISPVTGDITNSYADFWSYSTSVYGQCQIWNIGTNTFLVAYIDSAYDVQLGTVTINNAGKITKTFIDTLKLIDAAATAETNGLTIFSVDDPLVHSDGVLGITVRGIAAAEYDGYMYTFNVSSAGALGSAYASVHEFETTGLVTSTGISHVAGNYYVVVYTEFTSKDGFMATVQIETSAAPIAGSYAISTIGTTDKFNFSGYTTAIAWATGNATLYVYTNLTGSSDNCTAIYINATDITTDITANMFNCSVINTADGAWNSITNVSSFTTDYICLNSTTWTAGLSAGWIHGANPFCITDANVTLAIRLRVSIPAGITNGTYTADDWTINWKIED